MKQCQENAKYLTWFAPFRNMAVSAAYLTPFFTEHGLSKMEIFLLQSIFSAACLIWEIPSGYLADKFGRAFCIKLSAPIAAIIMIAYGFSSHFWQFVLLEIGLAIADGLISGVDTALLIDSLKANGQMDQYNKLQQRINAFGYAATAVCVPLAMLLVSKVSIDSTIVADGVLIALGSVFVFKLTEAPRFNGSQEEMRLSAWQAMGSLLGNKQAFYLIALGSVLSSSTYVTFWLTVPYFKTLGVPAVLFGLILAARNLGKAALSHYCHSEEKLQEKMVAYGLISGLVYLFMATQSIWLVWAVLGHDIVQALHSSPLNRKLNEHFDDEHRATMNSASNVFRKFAYAVAGPCAGLLVDKFGLSHGFVVIGLFFSALACFLVWQLAKLKTFK